MTGRTREYSNASKNESDNYPVRRSTSHRRQKTTYSSTTCTVVWHAGRLGVSNRVRSTGRHGISSWRPNGTERSHSALGLLWRNQVNDTAQRIQRRQMSSSAVRLRRILPASPPEKWNVYEATLTDSRPTNDECERWTQRFSAARRSLLPKCRLVMVATGLIIPGSKLTCSTNLFHHRLLAPTWTAFSDYTGPDLLCSTVSYFSFLFWVLR